MENNFYPVIKEIKTYVSGFKVMDTVPGTCIRIILIHNGSCTYVTESSSDKCYAANIIIIAPNTQYRIRFKSEDFLCSALDIAMVQSRFNDVNLSSAAKEYNDILSYLYNIHEPVIFNDDCGTYADFIKLLAIYISKKNFDRELPIKLLLVSIIKNINLQLKSIYRCTQYYSPYVNKAIRFIKSNYGKEISSGDVADYIGIHVNYLHKLFSNEVGKTLLQYIQELRISHAKELLRKPSLSIDQIAKDCCIGNIKYFYRAFKKHTGISPGEYRRSYNFTSSYLSSSQYEIVKQTSEEPITILENRKNAK